jgi:soluble lytic murein transglycosylase-like protein
MLISSVVHLSAEKRDNSETIDHLNNTIAGLEAEKALQAEEKKQLEFFRFKENVFDMKYPKFAKIAKIVYRKSREYEFSPYLVMALIQVESNFDRYAVSNAGAYGLMQINYSVWKDTLNIDYNRIFDEEYNIDLGLKVLKHYYQENSGNLYMALFRYNNGYKYNNTGYHAKIIATKFYSYRNSDNKTAGKDNKKKEDISI